MNNIKKIKEDNIHRGGDTEKKIVRKCNNSLETVYVLFPY